MEVTSVTQSSEVLVTSKIKQPPKLDVTNVSNTYLTPADSKSETIRSKNSAINSKYPAPTSTSAQKCSVPLQLTFDPDDKHLCACDTTFGDVIAAITGAKAETLPDLRRSEEQKKVRTALRTLSLQSCCNFDELEIRAKYKSEHSQLPSGDVGSFGTISIGSGKNSAKTSGLDPNRVRNQSFYNGMGIHIVSFKNYDEAVAGINAILALPQTEQNPQINEIKFCINQNLHDICSTWKSHKPEIPLLWEQAASLKEIRQELTQGQTITDILERCSKAIAQRNFQTL